MAESSELLQTQTCVEWRIKNFGNLSTEVGLSLVSPSFYFTDTEWKLLIYPNGAEKSEEFIDIFLYKATTTCKELCVDVRIGIKNYDSTVLKASSKVHKFKMGDHVQAFCKFITRSALKASNAVSPDGTLTIFCCVALVEESLVPSTNEVACQTSSPPTIAIEAASQTFSDGTSTLIRDLKDLYINSHQADLTITVKDKEFRVHSYILSCRSSVFKSMFLHDMMEKYSGSVEIPDGDPDTFEDFLLFLYTGQFDNVTSRNAVSLYRYADKYDVQELKDECVRRMIDKLTDDIFCDVLQLAALQNEQGLLKAVTDYFIKHAKTITVSSQWLTFLEENTQLGNELFIKLLNSKDNTEK